MFYCEDCRIKNQWPTGFAMSHGPCEVCGKVSICYDVYHGHLPVREPEPEEDGKKNEDQCD